MPVIFNGTTLPPGSKQYFNGTHVTKIFFNGVQVYQYDNVAPIITITSSTAIQYSPYYTVIGTVSDTESGVASVKVNGVEASRSGNNWSRTITLSQGVNNITVTATDVAGNTSSKSISVRYINSNPSRTDLLSPRREVQTENSGAWFISRYNSANELYYFNTQAKNVGGAAGIDQTFTIAIPKGVRNISFSGSTSTGFNPPDVCTINIIDRTTGVILKNVSNTAGDGNNKYANGSYQLSQNISFNHDVIITCYCAGHSYNPTWGGGAGGGFSDINVDYYS